MLAGIGPLGTPELIVIGILLFIVLSMLAAVIGLVVYLNRKGKSDVGKRQPPALPPEQG
ncbi:MAG: hypothetical protein V4662_08900 [Verrucomicrobiota bacterium]